MSHYIKLDAKNRIIAGFSDAFQTPQATDICILDDPDQQQRQFILADEYNPQLIDYRGMPIYKYQNGEILKTTASDNTDLIEKISNPPTDNQRISDLETAVAALAFGGGTV